jgi:hypothetical protein
MIWIPHALIQMSWRWVIAEQARYLLSVESEINLVLCVRGTSSVVDGTLRRSLFVSALDLGKLDGSLFIMSSWSAFCMQIFFPFFTGAS